MRKVNGFGVPYIRPLRMVILQLALQRYSCHEILRRLGQCLFSPCMHRASGLLHTHVFAKVLNLKVRSRASPSFARVQRPPDVERSPPSAEFAEVSSVPWEKRGCCAVCIIAIP